MTDPARVPVPAFLPDTPIVRTDIARHYDNVVVLGGIGASLVYTARGTAAGAFVPKARLWDLVAGATIVNRAGGELRYRSGRAIDYQALLAGQLAPEPIIAAHPELQTQLRELIEPHQGR